MFAFYSHLIQVITFRPETNPNKNSLLLDFSCMVGRPQIFPLSNYTLINEEILV